MTIDFTPDDGGTTATAAPAPSSMPVVNTSDGIDFTPETGASTTGNATGVTVRPPAAESASGGPIGATFPATGTEGPVAAALKTAGNVPASAANFAVGAVQFPFQVLQGIKGAPAAVGKDIADHGVFGGIEKAGNDLATSAYGMLPPFIQNLNEAAAGGLAKFIQAKAPGFAKLEGQAMQGKTQPNIPGTQGQTPDELITQGIQEASKSMQENPVGNVAPFIMAAREAAAAHSPATAAAFDRSISTIASPVTKIAGAAASVFPDFKTATPASRLEEHVKSGGASKTLTRAYEDSSTKTTNPIQTLDQNNLIKDIKVENGKVNVENLTNKQRTGTLDNLIQVQQDAGTAAVKQMPGEVSLDAFKEQALKEAKGNQDLQASGTVGRATAEIERRFEDYRNSYGDSLDYKQIDKIRKSMNKVWDSETWDAERAIGNAARNSLYEGAGAPGALTNEHIAAGKALREAMSKEGELLKAMDFARKVHGTAVKGGRLGKYIADATGASVGGAIGAGIPFVGPAIGGAIGAYLTDKGVSRMQSKYFNPRASVAGTVASVGKAINELPNGAEASLGKLTPRLQEGVKTASGVAGDYFKKNPVSIGLSLRDISKENGPAVPKEFEPLSKELQADTKPLTVDKKVYRGEGDGIGNTTLVKGKYFADSKEFASNFGEVSESTIPKGAKVFDLDPLKDAAAEKGVFLDTNALTKYLADRGVEWTRNTNTRGVEYVKLPSPDGGTGGLESVAKESKTFDQFRKTVLENYRLYGDEMKEITKGWNNADWSRRDPIKEAWDTAKKSTDDQQ